MNPNTQQPNPNVFAALSDQERAQARTALDSAIVDQFFTDRAGASGDARNQVLDTWDTNNETPAQILARVNDAQNQVRGQELDSYLANHGITDTHAAYDGARDLLNNYDHEDDVLKKAEWSLGTNGDPSGKERFEAEVNQLLGNTTPTTAEIAQLQAELEQARNELARISIQRRARLTLRGGKTSKRLAEEYSVAAHEYGDAFRALGVKSVELLRSDPTFSDDDIAKAVVFGTIDERRAFTEAETASLAQDTSFKNRIARYYANKFVMSGANVAVGLPVGFGAKKFAKYGFIAAAPVAGVAAVAAIRATKSIFTSTIGNRAKLHKDFERRQSAGMADIENRFTDHEKYPEGQVPSGADIDADRYAQGAHDLLVRSVYEGLKSDVNKNKGRAVMSAVLAGGSVALGAVIADHVHLPNTGEQPKMGRAVGDRVGSVIHDDQVLREAGVADPDLRRQIIANPDAFERWVTGGHGAGASIIDTHGTAGLSGGHEALADNIYTIHQGGGIIKDMIRPAAYMEGQGLTHAQETQIWQAMRTRFGDDLFTDLPVGSHGSDQWVLRSGQGTLRPEVARFLNEQIATLKTGN